MPRNIPHGGSNQSMVPGKIRIRYMADAGDGGGFTRHSETVYSTHKEADEILVLRAL